jgi:hypothetical protein
VAGGAGNQPAGPGRRRAVLSGGASGAGHSAGGGGAARLAGDACEQDHPAGGVWEIRQALGDQAATPQYLETIGHVGYRFLAATRDGQAAAGAPHPAPAAVFVGRQGELAHLQDCLAQAQQGVRQLVFVMGEAGIGKTTLLRQLLDHLPPAGPVWVGRGQCTEQTGPGEAYLPLLEALSCLGRAPGGERWVAALRRAAPTWLVHLPMLLEAGEVEALQRRCTGRVATACCGSWSTRSPW